MTRSEINQIIRQAAAFFEDRRFHLPAMAAWTPTDWLTKGAEIGEIIESGMGWDLTDFGRGRFSQEGLLLFTLRNGCARTGKPYAEKVMIVREGQLTLTHCHWHKTEDIINRGGGNLVLRLHNAAPDDKLADSPVTFQQDGVTRTLPAGRTVTLCPGDSITLTLRIYHSFWREAGKGPVLVGEVSSVNDDRTDNCFLEPQSRYPAIVEDEPPFRWLVSDYDSMRLPPAKDPR